MQLATEKEVLSLYPTNKINQQKNALLYQEAMKLRKKGLGARKISKIIDMPEGAIHYWLQGFEPKSVKGINELKDMNLLPLEISKEESFIHLVHTLGIRYADGCIYEQKRNNSYTYYLCFGDKLDALTYIKDSKRIWNINLNLYQCSRAYYIYLPSSLARLTVYLGSPVGNKTLQLFSLPYWVFSLPSSLKWEFISGLFSGDGSTPKLKPSNNSCETIKLSLSSEKSITKRFANLFIYDIWDLLTELGIKVSKPTIKWNQPRYSKNGKVTYPIEIRILTRKDNMIKFLKNIKYKYTNKAYIRAKKILNILEKPGK